MRGLDGRSFSSSPSLLPPGSGSLLLDMTWQACGFCFVFFCVFHQNTQPKQLPLGDSKQAFRALSINWLSDYRMICTSDTHNICLTRVFPFGLRKSLKFRIRDAIFPAVGTQVIVTQESVSLPSLHERRWAEMSLHWELGRVSVATSCSQFSMLSVRHSLHHRLLTSSYLFSSSASFLLFPSE